MKAALILSDGSTFFGSGFGYPCEVSGETVFNTGMTGYCESLTDPSYSNQILVQTYPLIGNYGVQSYSITDKFGMPLHFESNKIQVKGYVISSLSQPSHWSCDKNLDEWLYEQKIPGIQEIDTREITKRLRKRGTMPGILKISDDIDIENLKEKLTKIEDSDEKNLVEDVSIEEPMIYNRGDPNIVLIDCGVKFGILRNLLARNVSVVRVPYNYSIERILNFNPAGVLISNGPGDPKKCRRTIKTVGELLKTGLPIMGICLGSQILALSAGADTYKSKFGHRGQNHPVIDLKTKRCYITSQNHGYAVDPKTINDDFEVSFINANDKTVEGIRHKKRTVFGVQWHPEGPGPYETGFLFDEFVREVNKYANK